MHQISFILIDPQAGFCSPSGSLAKHYSLEEMIEIQRALNNLKRSLSGVYHAHLVTSEYSRGQFTGGDLQHPLAGLCVPTENNDCDLVEELESVRFNSHYTKKFPSAMSSEEFNAEIEKDLEQRRCSFVISRFLLEHCVLPTAMELMAKVSKSGAKVIVCKDFSASRLEKYSNGEVQNVIQKLKGGGVSYESWQSIAQ